MSIHSCDNTEAHTSIILVQPHAHGIPVKVLEIYVYKKTHTSITVCCSEMRLLGGFFLIACVFLLIIKLFCV